MIKPLILLVDDDLDILEFLSFSLTRNGFEVLTAESGFQALEIVKQKTPNIILLDMMMPGIDGLETCKRLRQIGSLQNTIIIFLTAISDDSTQIDAYKNGADDYINKPIKTQILINKLNAILRRLDFVHNLSSLSSSNNILVDKDNYLVKVRDEEVILSKKEFELFVYLFNNPNKIHSREQIYSAVWGDEVIVGERTIDVHIKKIRDKLGIDYIKTYKGIGYKYEEK